MAERARVAVVQTHPVQYLAPWFRWIAQHEPSIDLTVLYAVEPTPAAQAAGFGGAFTWDLPLREGYANRVLSETPFDGALEATGFSSVDAPGLEQALIEIEPHAVLVPGWHAAYYRRALRACARHRWPVLYRGDSTLQSGRRGVPGWLRMAVTRRRLRRFDAFLSVGARSREYLLAHGVLEPLVCHSPHAVDVAWLEAAAARHREASVADRRGRLGLDPGRAVILFAGKLTTHKRPLDVIRAVARVDTPVQLLMAGSGPLDADCRNEATRLGVPATFTGFLQPDALTAAYAAADVLAVPSVSESWGLVVNEALASGVPCVVSDAVGCAPDLVGRDTGAVYPVGDVPALAEALTHGLVLAANASTAEACRARSRRHTHAEAARGMVAALRRLRVRAACRAEPPARARVLACCGGMVAPGGLERMTFEALGVARARGASVHCIVNRWGSSAIVDLGDAIGASWSTGYYWYRLDRRLWRPAVAARMLTDITCTSAGLLRDAWRLGATVVLVPDHTTLLRNWPALAALRLLGTRIVHRLGTAPEAGSWYARLWRWVIAPTSHVLVCNSDFTARTLIAHGVTDRKVMVIPNVLPSHREQPVPHQPPIPGRLVYVGQIIPGKGVHLLLDALTLLLQRGHDVSLDVVGNIDGWESPTWQGYRASLVARAAPLGARVRFLGWRDDVAACLAGAWIHVAPSLPEIREGFGLVVLEAKGAGVPSVVGPSGALPDLITDGVDGAVMTGPTAESLAAAVVPLLEPATREAASRAASRSLSRYAPDAFAEAWDAAFGWQAIRAVPAEPASCR